MRNKVRKDYKLSLNIKKFSYLLSSDFCTIILHHKWQCSMADTVVDYQKVSQNSQVVYCNISKFGIRPCAECTSIFASRWTRHKATVQLFPGNSSPWLMACHRNLATGQKSRRTWEEARRGWERRWKARAWMTCRDLHCLWCTFFSLVFLKLFRAFFMFFLIFLEDCFFSNSLWKHKSGKNFNFHR